MSGETYYCGFCGRSQHESKTLIAGVMCFICDECVEICRDIVGANRVSKTGALMLWHPKSIPGFPTTHNAEHEDQAR